MRLFKRAIMIAVVLLYGCDGSESGRALWQDVVKKCAGNDLLGKDVLYFGPSNPLGPGSVWRKGDANNAGYYVRWLPSNIDSNPNVFIKDGTSFNCAGTSTTTTKVSPTVALQTSVVPVGANFNADFGKARKTTVTVDAAQWDQVVEGPFDQAIKALDSNNPVKIDLRSGTRYVSVRALRITGMSADLEFSHDDALELKAKYNGPLGALGTGDLGVGFNAQWKGDTVLHLTSTAQFYVAGELRPYTSTIGLSAGRQIPFGPIETAVSSAKVGKDDTPK